VSASGAVAAEFKGDVPVIQTETWQGLKPAEQKACCEERAREDRAAVGRASSGRVTCKVF
jgi:hypothetical protein